MTEPKTADSLRATFDKLRDDDARRATERAERIRAFYDSVPQRLHGHPLVTAMALAVETQAPMHPATHKELRRQYEALLADGGDGQ